MGGIKMDGRNSHKIQNKILISKMLCVIAIIISICISIMFYLRMFSLFFFIGVVNLGLLFISLLLCHKPTKKLNTYKLCPMLRMAYNYGARIKTTDEENVSNE
jgi:hypothetical protein